VSTPAIIWIVLATISFTNRINNIGKPGPALSFWQVVIFQALSIGLLTWGGFFGTGCSS